MPLAYSRPPNLPLLPRIAALLIASMAWIGVAIYFAVLTSQGEGVLTAVWKLLGYFTITTNLVVAVVFSGIAAGSAKFAHPWIVGGSCLSILLVGVVYGLLLHGLVDLSGGSVTANLLLHVLTPLLVPLFWALFVSKGALKLRDIFLWALYPLVYLFYALLRGQFTGHYAYPFINVAQYGWTRVAANAAMIALAYLAASWLFVKIDRQLGRRGALQTVR
jgi:hypothetical protein